ncbi:MAG: cysteate synthase [Candidatus Lustribacter sp.]|jgi:cysteate synthase
MREYRLRCTGCGATFPDDGVRLDCPNDHAAALLRTEYDQRSFVVTDEPSIQRYGAWLPRGREIATAAQTAVYRSTALAGRLGLDELWIAFNGWWPERGASLRTATFKELEAYAVLARIGADESRTLVVASAGNTAAAFADACTVNDIPLVIIVPANAFERVASIARIGPSVKIVALEDAEYEDAIAFSRQLGAEDDFILEGGVRNVARRDGLGIVLLAAADAIGAIPDYYFQAVASAAGALGVREAAQRLIGDGRFGRHVPQLMLAQNAPFTPLYDAWSVGAPVLIERSVADARRQIAQIGAQVLTNQTPPYAIAGGVREALDESSGNVFAIENNEMVDAMMLFAELEGIDIDPEAGVATAALMRAVTEGSVKRDRRVLLNVTGGGRAGRVRETREARPALVLDRADAAAIGNDAVRSVLFSSRL